MPSLTKLCSIEKCEKPLIARGWCSTHYWRWRKYGDVNHPVERREPHGMWKNKVYHVWLNIRQRTTNQKHKAYDHYGGRGIKVCKAWSRSFQVFYQDIGEKPSGNHSIDRIDNDGNYSCGRCEECIEHGWPMNVRWATKAQQSINTRMFHTNTSGYRGVSFQHNRYVATISVNNKQVYLGRFIDQRDAALAFNEAAIKYRGDDAKLNDI